VADGNQIKLFA